MEKRKNIYIGIFAVAVVGIACFAIYLSTEIKNLKGKLNESKTADSALNLEANTYNNQSEIPSSNVSVKEVEKIIEKGIFVPFDTNKKKFETDLTYELLGSEVLGCTLSLKNDGKVYLNLSSTESENYKELKAPVNTDIEITGFSKKVLQAFIGTHGNGFNYPMILFLMQDGTLEYLNSEYAFQNNKFVSAGKVAGLENIVRLESAGARKGYSGVTTVIAIDKDGYYYDVHGKINNY